MLQLHYTVSFENLILVNELPAVNDKVNSVGIINVSIDNAY